MCTVRFFHNDPYIYLHYIKLHFDGEIVQTLKCKRSKFVLCVARPTYICHHMVELKYLLGVCCFLDRPHSHITSSNPQSHHNLPYYLYIFQPPQPIFRSTSTNFPNPSHKCLDIPSHCSPFTTNSCQVLKSVQYAHHLSTVVSLDFV